jgi:saccharopine dehydrogenase-like NADP-dependent oxidoreductase
MKMEGDMKDGMRILVCGGGEEGTTFARDLLEFYGDRVSKIVIGDKNLENAKKAEAEIGSSKASVQRLDISDHKELVEAIKNVDLVMNYVGPFYRWGNKVLKAAIEAKKNYIDIDDDSESTLQCLDLDEEARAAGITAIIGLGSGPGADNLLARYGAEKLDRVDEINIYWVGNFRYLGSRLQPRAVYAHALNGIQKAGPQFINGEFVNPPPGSGATWVDFDAPIGRAECLYFAHPEAVTLPRYIKGLKTATNRGGLIPDFRMRRLREALDLGLAQEKPIEVEGKLVSPISFMCALEDAYPPPEYPGDNTGSAIKIEIRGMKNGKPHEYIYGGATTSMAKATAAPAAIGALMIYEGDIKKKGVFAPEGCIDNFRKFMSELKKRGI